MEFIFGEYFVEPTAYWFVHAWLDYRVLMAFHLFSLCSNLLLRGGDTTG